MARYVEVRAPNELSALAAAHAADPVDFPMTVTSDDVIITPRRAQQLPTPRPIPGVEDVPLDLELAQQTVPGSTIDLAQQRATPGTFTGAWKVVDSNTGEELHRFSGIGNSQEDANRVAGQWVRSNSIAVPTEVYPIMSESVAETKNPNTTYKLWTAPVKIKQPTYTGYIDVAVTAQNAQLARQLMKAQYGVADWEIGSVKEVKV
jgi:hypothetical protein